MKPKIFVTRTIDAAGIERLRAIGEVTQWGHDEPIPRDKLLAGVAGVDAVLSLLTDQIDDEVLAAAGPQLKIVANHAIGYDNIDLAAAARRNVVVTNTPARSAQFVAEHALGLMLAVGRRIVEADRFVRRGDYEGWTPMAFLGETLWGRTLGIVGCGEIGHLTAEVAHRAFGMPVLYYDVVPNRTLEEAIGAKAVGLDDLLRQADIVSIHVPLLPQTKHLIGRTQLGYMKPTATLINTSRGPVVDEAALYDALRHGIIMGAGLDVFEREPALYPGLATLNNVVLTPHIASATPEARKEMAEMAAQNIVAVLSGEPPVNPVGGK